MRLTKRAEYAIKAMLDLALQGKQLTAVRQMSERQDIPLPFLEKILIQLRQSGLVNAQRGSKGGYSLGKSIKEITIGQILEAIGENPFIYQLDQQVDQQVDQSELWLDHILSKRIYEKINDVILHIPLSELYYDLLSWQANQSATFIV